MVLYIWYVFFCILMGRSPLLCIILQRIWGHTSRENLNFLNITNAGFWHSGWLFALSQMLSLQNLKEFFWWPPLFTQSFLPAPRPLKPYFWACPSLLKSHQPPLPNMKWTVPSTRESSKMCDNMTKFSKKYAIARQIRSSLTNSQNSGKKSMIFSFLW